MKAHRVKGLDPDRPLAEQAARIIDVRLDELYGFIPRALDPAEVAALHDMRIAAKRLRYLLEMFAPIFGAYAATGAKQAKQLQDLIGEIHDCDVTLPRVRAFRDALQEQDAEALRQAGGAAADLDPALAGAAPHADAWRGLGTYELYLRGRRALLFERFLELWHELDAQLFAARVRSALDERSGGRPPVTPPSHAGNGHDEAQHLPSTGP